MTVLSVTQPMAVKQQQGGTVVVDENKIKGRAERIKGKVERTVGRVTGSRETELRGYAGEAKGTAREVVADVKAEVKKASSRARSKLPKINPEAK